MRTFVIFALVLMQFTVLPFFSLLASAHEDLKVPQWGVSVVYKTSEAWPDFLKDRLSHAS